jgi:hypothetical protein
MQTIESLEAELKAIASALEGEEAGE